MNEERLRRLYGRGILARDARSELAGACQVEPERLLALVRRELPEEERLALLDRVMASSACREAFELLRVVEAAGRSAGAAPEAGAGEVPVTLLALAAPPAAVPSVAAPSAAASSDIAPAAAATSAARSGAATRTPARWWRGGGATVALAASALLAVGLVARDRPATGGEPTRGTGDAVTLLAPATDPASAAAASGFVWNAVPGASRYEFELLGADGEPMHQATTADTTLALPATVTLEPGVGYSWLVRAITASGGQRSSPVRTLRLTAR